MICSADWPLTKWTSCLIWSAHSVISLSMCFCVFVCVHACLYNVHALTGDPSRVCTCVLLMNLLNSFIYNFSKPPSSTGIRHPSSHICKWHLEMWVIQGDSLLPCVDIRSFGHFAEDVLYSDRRRTAQILQAKSISSSEPAFSLFKYKKKKSSGV